MRFHRGANVRFHLACASVCKQLLLEARQGCRDNLTRLSSAFPLVVLVGSCIRGLKKSCVKQRTPKVAAATENIRVN